MPANATSSLAPTGSRNLKDWEYKVADMTQRIAQAFDGKCTSPLPMGHTLDVNDLTIDYCMWTNLYTIAAPANIGFSEYLRFLDQGSDIVTSEVTDGTLKKTLCRISKVVPSTYLQKWKLTKDWNGIVYNRETTREKRYEEGEKLDDFFSALMKDKSGTPNNLEWGEIVAEVSIMMNAGSNTAGIALNNVMLLLLKNPHCLMKLREEIDSLIEKDEVIASYNKVKHLSYLQACLDESMRMFPPVSFHVPHRTPEEGTTIRGDFVAGDTSIGISAQKTTNLNSGPMPLKVCKRASEMCVDS
ncbi:hypothetical protein BBP40_001210 [Aspergillus hancockii]|nr:hypothetical protein BBP40_001210 [Aspergillus hancockii]